MALNSPLSALAYVLSNLVSLNLLLGAFNLIPAFPLDGGRVFRSIVWGVTHRYERATAIASVVGQAFGYVLAVLGLARMFVFGDVVGGMWTIFIGWFLSQSASATRRERQLRNTIRGVHVSQVMDPRPAVVEAGSTVQQLVFEQLLRTGQQRLVENARAILAAIVRSKPSTAKGNYVTSVAISSTMGPGVKIDNGEARTLAAAA